MEARVASRTLVDGVWIWFIKSTASKDDAKFTISGEKRFSGSAGTLRGLLEGGSSNSSISDTSAF